MSEKDAIGSSVAGSDHLLIAFRHTIGGFPSLAPEARSARSRSVLLATF